METTAGMIISLHAVALLSLSLLAAADPSSSSAAGRADPSGSRLARSLAGNGNEYYNDRGEAYYDWKGKEKGYEYYNWKNNNYRWPPTTCDDRHRKVCLAGGSAGPDCCGNRCVNTATDSNNCGACGMRCWYGSRCCGGRCVGVMYDPQNCGGCGRKCGGGSHCRYGMCSYGY